MLKFDNLSTLFGIAIALGTIPTISLHPTSARAAEVSRERGILLLADASENLPHVLSNGRWRVEISSNEPWSGANGTGNFTYRGCDNKGRCITLTRGTASCREGVCATTWRNGEYFYVVSSTIGENAGSTTLTVWKGSQKILHETGFQTVE